MPCVYSGISGQAMPLYKKLGFTFIDCAPMSQIPLSFPAFIREWRTRLYRMEKEPTAQSGNGALRALRLTLRSRRSAETRATTAWLPLGARESHNEVERLAKIDSRMFQIPWSTHLLSSALKGDEQHLRAVVFEKAGLSRARAPPGYHLSTQRQYAYPVYLAPYRPS